MIKFGVQDNILEQGYFSSTECDNCGHKEQNNFTVWTKAFFLGPWLFPNLRWFQWNKNAVVTCNNCHRTLSVEETSGHLKERLQEKYDNYPLWTKNAFICIVVAYLAYSIIF